MDPVVWVSTFGVNKFVRISTYDVMQFDAIQCSALIKYFWVSQIT